MKLVKRLLLDLDFELAVFKITAGKKTDQIGQLAAVEFIGECYAQDIGIRSAVNGRNFGCSPASFCWMSRRSSGDSSRWQK